jgi:tetratricopeptide (TPR) repeat protein
MIQRVAAISFCVLLALASTPARGDGHQDLYAAIEMERVEGDLEAAIALYRRAAAAGEPEIVPAARLGMGRCLRRLDRIEEAREILASLKETEVAAAAERELARLARPATGEPAEAPAAAADSAAEEKARDESNRAALARWYLSQARSVYREARFDEAREWVRLALEVEPTNPQARELLLRLGDAPDDRGMLIREVFRLLDAERRLRLDDLTMQSDALLSTGQELLLRGEQDAAVARFDECIALLDQSRSFDEGLSIRRRRAVEFREQAVLRGGKSPAAAPPAPAPPKSPWRETLRALLLDLGTPRHPGDRMLRIHDLSGFAGPSRDGPAESGQLTLTAEHPWPGDLLVGLLPEVVEPAAWIAGDHLLRAQGTDLVLYAPEGIQDAVRDLLTRLGTRQDPAARLTIVALATTPRSLSRAAGVAEATFSPRGPGACAVLTREQYERLADVLTRHEQAEPLGRLEVTVPPERTLGVEQVRTLNFEAPPGEDGEPVLRVLRYGYSADLLPIFTPDGFGLAVRAETRVPGEALSLPARTTGSFRVPSLATEQIEAAALVPPGGALVLAGLSNPFEQGSISGRKCLVLLLSPAETGPENPLEEAPAIAPAEVESTGSTPVDLGDLFLKIGDEPAPPFRGGPPIPGESRTGFLLSWLAEALGGDFRGRSGNSLTIGQGAVWVHGDPEFKGQVKALVERLLLHSAEMVSMRVRAARISAREEALIFRGLSPAGRVVRGEGVRVHLLTGDDRGRVVYEIAGSEGRLSLLPRQAEARSTQLVNLSRVTTTRYLRGHVDDGGTPRPIYDHVDEGLVVELRPIVLEDGMVDLTAGVRVARILDRGPSGASPGASGSTRPMQAISTAQVRVPLTGNETLMISGIPAPTPIEDDRDRLVVLVETVKGR